jgi:hypothetical protein
MPAIPVWVYGVGAVVAGGGYLLGRRAGLSSVGVLSPPTTGPSPLSAYPGASSGGNVGYGASPVVTPGGGTGSTYSGPPSAPSPPPTRFGPPPEGTEPHPGIY